MTRLLSPLAKKEDCCASDWPDCWLPWKFSSPPPESPVTPTSTIRSASKDCDWVAFCRVTTLTDPPTTPLILPAWTLPPTIFTSSATFAFSVPPVVKPALVKVVAELSE